MKKEKKWSISDFLIGFIISLVIIGFYFWSIPFMETLEYKLYDLRAKTRQTKTPNPSIILVGIDEKSIGNIGRWPWPRSVIAQVIDVISSGKPKVIGLNILFTEEEQNQGLEEIRTLKQKYITEVLPLTKKIKTPSDRKLITDFLTAMSDSEEAIDNDTILTESISSAKNVILPMFFVLGTPLSKEQDESYNVISRSVITNVTEEGKDQKRPSIIEAHTPVVPYEEFAKVCSGVGYANNINDSDGVIRHYLPVLKSMDKYYPSFVLQLARMFLGYPIEEIKVDIPQRKVTVGKAEIPLDENMQMLIDFTGPNQTYQYYSVFDILSEKIPPSIFKNKIVIVGYMATGLADLNIVPVSNNMSGTELLANILQNILEQKFIVRPVWAFKVEIAMLIFCGMFITFLLPRLKALWSSIFTLFIVAMILFAGFYLFKNHAIWIKIFYPSCLLISGYLIITSKKFLFTEKRKELVETESIETNKMLGLSFQGQGMLDLAFEKFRRCPIDDSMKELLYNLALDFERKRQYNKAVAVYEHIQTVDKKYKNIEERIKMLKNVADGAVIGGIGQRGKSETVIITEGQSQKPTLGRYEIIKELGRGAMGIVYLGKDPKINRTVAIKTLRFEDDVSEEEIKAVKERFFREAESAGKLSHPNIIKIYDAGEDYDVSYIAMELLQGRDLKIYCEKDKLLPVPDVISYMIQVAEALDYAHQNGVIHRDIKPANVMILNDGTLRVTDFGIARIMESSKTQTGTVLGTPSYMSPEQISGKKVDGRSDLFSLGVMLYELLTGEKPFKGDSIATLLFQITSAEPPNPKEIRKDLPDCLIPVILKSLRKNPEERYQRGKELADDLRKCLDIITGKTTSGTIREDINIQKTNQNFDVNIQKVEAEKNEFGTIKLDPDSNLEKPPVIEIEHIIKPDTFQEKPDSGTIRILKEENQDKDNKK